MRNTIIALAIILSISSCKNLVPYSDALRSKYNLGIDQLKQVQFYASSPIVLQRKIVDQKGAEVYAGKIKVVNGEKIEEVIVPSGTPGVLVRDDDGKLEVSFERDDMHYLRFGSNPNANNEYCLLAADWKHRIGSVIYAGNKYYTSPESANAILLIDLHKIIKSEKEYRVAKGRKL